MARPFPPPSHPSGQSRAGPPPGNRLFWAALVLAVAGLFWLADALPLPLELRPQYVRYSVWIYNLQRDASALEQEVAELEQDAEHLEELIARAKVLRNPAFCRHPIEPGSTKDQHDRLVTQQTAVREQIRFLQNRLLDLHDELARARLARSRSAHQERRP